MSSCQRLRTGAKRCGLTTRSRGRAGTGLLSRERRWRRAPQLGLVRPHASQIAISLLPGTRTAARSLRSAAQRACHMSLVAFPDPSRAALTFFAPAVRTPPRSSAIRIIVSISVCTGLCRRSTDFPSVTFRWFNVVMPASAHSCKALWPNHAFNRTRRYGPSTWRSSLAAGRLTWSC
jgi:hypothetical protein